MKKALSSLAIILALSFLGNPPVFAADIDVVCSNDGPCIATPNTLFSETNFAPGESVSKSILAQNNDENDTCSLVMDLENVTQEPSNFASQLFTAVRGTSTALYGGLASLDVADSTKSFADLVSGDDVDLGVLTPAGGTNTYNWVATFDSDAGNEFQGAEMQFDFDLAFTCSHEGEDHTNDNGDGDGGGGGIGGGVAGITTSFFAPFTQVAGATSTPEATETPETIVAGIKDVFEDAGIVCEAPLWWLILLLQLLIHLIIYFIRKRNENFGRILYIVLQIIVLAIFFYIFAVYICLTWPKWFSLLLGAIAILL